MVSGAPKAESASSGSPGRGVELRARLRVRRGADIALGPGKAELLESVGETGSIAESARRMGMSYMRAWSLIKVMNRSFKEPLVSAERGGAEGGGARLTEAGVRAARLYRRMETSALRGAGPAWRQLKSLLRG